MINNCPICSGVSFEKIFQFDCLPLYNLEKHRTVESALNTLSGKVDFVKCKECGFVFNQLFEQLSYEVEYEAGRSSSDVFNQYLSEIVSNLTHAIDNNIYRVVEIGAGNCEFAMNYIANRNIDYIAIDTSWHKTRLPEVKGVKCVAGSYRNEMKLKPDMLVLRHVLEHISKVRGFMSSILFEKPQYVFIEIPCYEFVRNNNYHLFSYEHCSYFTKQTLTQLMHFMGYGKVFIKYIFNRENIISLWQKQSASDSTELISEKEVMNPSVDNLKGKSFKNWVAKIRPLFNNKSVLWGGSGKGVMILNLLGVQYTEMPYVIDINPKRWGDYIPITGQKILPPESIHELNIKTVLVPNKIYFDEVEKIIDSFGYSCQIKYIN